ncbi:MAG: DNA polymerase Y family protein [Xanthomonadales bacterium]|nr:DNA polymerase Y family protein [Xanthomonadales bacterium]
MQKEKLWLALHCPHLALDLVSRSDDNSRQIPLVISDNHKSRPGVFDCNPPAARAGVQTGMPLNAALGLQQGLRVLHRDIDAERHALERMAGWCYRYSASVSLYTQDSSLVLEVGASERLFGNARELSARLGGELLQLGYQAHCGSAPTVSAALLAARHGLHIQHRDQLKAQLGKLALDSIGLDPSLAKMGFRSLAEIFRLPRKSLARRMGPEALDYLDRLTGARPEPVATWQPPEHFSAAMDLAAELNNSQALLFPLRRLVAEMCGSLRARDRGIQSLQIRLFFDRRDTAPQSLRLNLQQPSRCESHILLLVRERLERLQLPAPVTRVAIKARPLLPFDAVPDSLFHDDPELGAQPVTPLLERLQARLGIRAVQGLKGCEDHRPERSWAVRELDEPADCTAMPHRPAWLFTQPQRCRIEDYELLAGPERIEAGWWDGHDCRRDYFVVRDRHGSVLWAFCEYKPEPGWYLQGMFS